MLKNLRLSNFRSHRDTTIEFTNGLNVIIGENGAGKSSIFQAIGIGLFNSVHNMKELVRYNETTATVDITFAFAGVTYRSVREFGKTSSWRLFRSDEVMADGPEAVVKEISKIFGLTEILDLPTFFNEMIGVGQFNMTSPFTQSLTPRKAFFNRLLGTDEYLKVSNDLREGEKYGESLLKDDEIKLVEYKTQLKFYQEGQAEKQGLSTTLIELKDNLVDLLTQKQLLQDELDKQKVQKRTFTEAKELQTKYQFQREQLEKEIKFQKQLIEIAAVQLKEVQEAMALLPQIELEYQAYQLQLSQYDEEIKRGIELGTQKRLLEKRHDTLINYDTCPICNSNIVDQREYLLEMTTKELAEVSELISENGSKPQPPKNYEVIKQQANSYEIYSDKYDGRIDDLEPLELKLREVYTLLSNVELPEYDELVYEQVQIDFIKVQTNIATTEVKIEATMRRMDEISKQKNPLQQITTLQKQIKSKQQSLDTLKSIRNVYKQLGPIMAQRLLKQINEEARVLFNDLLGEHYRVDVTIEDEYEIEAVIDGNKVSFNNLSGGQQVCLALAIRLALLKTLSGMEFMLIDEPFDSLDPLSQEAVIKSLSELNLGQLVVITHNDAFDADNVIKFELVEGVSKCV